MKHRFIFAILMSLLLSFLMTCWVTWLNLDWNPNFLGQWMHAFSLAWPAAAIIAFFIAPEIHKLATKLAS